MLRNSRSVLFVKKRPLQQGASRLRSRQGSQLSWGDTVTVAAWHCPPGAAAGAEAQPIRPSQQLWVPLPSTRELSPLPAHTPASLLALGSPPANREGSMFA